MSIADLRDEYLLSGLSEADVLPDPLAQFQRWFGDALEAQVPMPNAMTLATITPDGMPDARVVLLKGIDQGGFVFFTNYTSAKGRQLDTHPVATLVFLWAQLERQVRISGPVTQVSQDESDAYFCSRPLGSQLAAWASAQSQTVADRQQLETALAAAQHQFGQAPPRPPHWGGYRLLPQSLEFWQGRANRLHDRLRYRRDGGDWRIERLAP